MEKQILTEIRRIKQMMNLPLLSEQKDELYNLLIKLGREGEDEAEKIEIRNALKKQGFSDVEIRSIAAGGEDILNNAVRRLEQKVATQGLGELEEILIKQGISRDAIASLPDGSYFINGVEGLYLRKKNGIITDEQYQRQLNDVINALSDVSNEAELKRAIKSIELDVDKKIGKKVETEIITDRPLNVDEIITNPELNKTLEEFVGTEIANKARKEFEGMSDVEIKKLYDEFKAGLIRDEDYKKKIADAFTKDPTLKEKWKKLKTWQKAVLIPSISVGVITTLCYLKNRGISGLIGDVKSLISYLDYITKSDEAKQEIKTQEELSDYVQKISNYGVYDKKTNEFLIDLEGFIEAEGTVENQIKIDIPNEIKKYYESNKDDLNPTFVYNFMENIAKNKIQPIFENVEDFIGKFVVKAFEDKDPNRPKNIKRTLSDLVKNFREKFDTEYKKGVLKLNPKAEEKQKRDWEQPKPKYPDNF